MSESLVRYQKMVPEAKTLLLEALRSNRYKQAVARMRVTKRSSAHYIERNGVGHCCLGVLTDVALKEGVISSFRINERGQGCSMQVLRWAGFDVNTQTKLMKLNDGNIAPHAGSKPIENLNRKNFHEIAEWIEANL